MSAPVAQSPDIPEDDPRHFKTAVDRLHVSVLDLIFGHCSSSDLASAALVSRSWSSPALDALWKEIYDLECLLSILGCRWKLVNSTEMLWTTYPTPAAWTRFWIYADRIRVLDYFGDDWTFAESTNRSGVFLSAQVAGQLSHSAHASGRPAILPKLRKIVWYPSPGTPDSQFLYFAPSSLQTVILKLGEVDEELINEKLVMTLGSLSSFLPQLEEFHLETSNNVDSETINLAFDNLVIRCQSLKRIRFSVFHTTQEIISCFGKLSRLEHLAFGLRSPQTYPELLELLRDVRSALPPLIGLTISLYECHFAIDGDSFRVFRSWGQLELFQIAGPSGVTLTDNDVMEMGESWRMMKNLCLECSEATSNLPLTIIPAMAKAFPNLITLVLPVQLDCRTLKPDRPLFSFRKLRFLAMEWSDTLQENGMRPDAEFLSKVLPPGASVGSKREPLDLFNSVHREFYSEDPRWAEINLLVKMIHRAQERSGLEIIERVRAGLINHTLTLEMLTREGDINNTNSLWRLLGKPSY